MKNKLFIGLAVLVGLFAAWIVLLPGKTPWGMLFPATPTPTPALVPLAPAEQPAPTGPKSPAGFTPAAVVPQDANGFPLSIGSKGSFVIQIQKALNKKFGSGLVEDGIFGPKTEKALKVNGFNNGVIYYKHYYEIIN